MLDGYYARMEVEHQRAAWLASNILSAWVKDMTPEKLLGPAFMHAAQQRRRE